MSSYKPVSNKPNFNALEEEIIAFWKENNIFKKSIELRANAEPFVFYEGPPTANGRPGVHHVLARTFKDLVCRYQTMQGKRVERKAGWDEHGLPVEIEVQKQFNLKSKTDIEAMGIAEFNKYCAESTQKYIGEWEKLTERMAYWVDFDNAYKTSSPEYIEKVWGILKTLSDKKLLYKGFKVIPWACDSGTVVSQAEVALGYKDVIDESAYIKFKLTEESIKKIKNKFSINDEKPIYMLAWTTTPWTLPSNMALAISPDIEYSFCSKENEYIILSKKRIKPVLEEFQEIGSLKGLELIDYTYNNLFDDSKINNIISGINLKQIVFVEDSESTGTGIVHIAPAFGADDFETYKANKIKSEIINLISPDGFFNEQSPTFLKGESIFNDNKKTGQKEFIRINKIITKHLDEKGLLLKTEKYEHSYPHNWRTNNPLIYYLRPSWYIATSSLREQLLKANEQIEWYPEHIKDGRFGQWLEGNIDWSISRERYWGTPIPIWINSKGDYQVIGSFDELSKKINTFNPSLKPLLEKLKNNPHKPLIDEIEWTENGELYKRVGEVLDCWFDSGSMPIASNDLQNPTQFIQADYICEAVDQTRGWFYTLLAISVALDERPAYKKVICLGHILDGEGQKMSKSKGNIINPWELFEKFGADPVRWFMIANCSAGNPIKFDIDGINEIMRRFILPLWNTYSFYTLYANLDGVNSENIEKIPSELLERQLQTIDAWIMARLTETHKLVTKEYENFEFAKATLLIEKFIDDLSNIWVRANRNRFWGSTGSIDWIAYNTLQACLFGICQISAPFIPLLSESIYQNLKANNSPESVHLIKWLQSEENTEEEKSLINAMYSAQEIISLGRNLRQELKLKIRQPLSQIIVPKSYMKDSLKYFESLILSELNIKELLFSEIETIKFNTEITEELLSEGLARELIHTIQNLRKNSGLQVSDRIKLYLNCNDIVLELLESQFEYIKTEVLALDLIINENTNNIPYKKTLKLNGENCEIALLVHTNE